MCKLGARNRHLKSPTAGYHPEISLIVEPPSGVEIMAIAAHPDDIESWCAGTLARAIDAGCEARLLLVTSGQSGSDDPKDTPERVGARRRAEAREAARELGLTEVAFLDYPDGAVENTQALRRDLVVWIRRWKPDILFTHDPEHPLPPYLGHRDHRVVGRAALDAIYPLARDCLSFPELDTTELQPHAVQSVWLFASAVADSFVDISRGFERKIAARLQHRSQTPDPAALSPSWRARAARIGEPVGLPLAEAFTIVDCPD